MSIIYEALKKMSQRDASAQNDSQNESNPPQKPASSSAEVKPEGNACLPARQGAASDSRSHKPGGNGAASDSRSHKPGGNGAASDSRSHKSTAKNKIALALVGTTVGIIITWLVMDKPVAQFSHNKIQSVQQTPPVARLNNQELPATVNDAQSQNNEEKLPVQEAPELTLNGIVLSADGNLALINEEILQAGDDIRGAKVEEITDKQVTLTFQNQEIVLKKK